MQFEDFVMFDTAMKHAIAIEAGAAFYNFLSPLPLHCHLIQYVY